MPSGKTRDILCAQILTTEINLLMMRFLRVSKPVLPTTSFILVVNQRLFLSFR